MRKTDVSPEDRAAVLRKAIEEGGSVRHGSEIVTTPERLEEVLPTLPKPDPRPVGRAGRVADGAKTPDASAQIAGLEAQLSELRAIVQSGSVFNQTANEPGAASAETGDGKEPTAADSDKAKEPAKEPAKPDRK